MRISKASDYVLQAHIQCTCELGYSDSHPIVLYCTYAGHDQTALIGRSMGPMSG
jgi:hypothetical protein